MGSSPLLGVEEGGQLLGKARATSPPQKNHPDPTGSSSYPDHPRPAAADDDDDEAPSSSSCEWVWAAMGEEEEEERLVFFVGGRGEREGGKNCAASLFLFLFSV